MATITSANSVFTLAVKGLFPVAQVIQGYAADDSFTSDAVELSEGSMGVDGFAAFGKVKNLRMMSVTLMPSSPSLQMFDAIVSTMEGTGEVLALEGMIRMPSISRSYYLQNGVLKSAPPFPAHKKVLQPMVFQFMWQAIIGAPI